MVLFSKCIYYYELAAYVWYMERVAVAMYPSSWYGSPSLQYGEIRFVIFDQWILLRSGLAQFYHEQ